MPQPARVKWKRTVIGGNTLADDFTAVDPETGHRVGRLILHSTAAPGTEGWRWYGNGEYRNRCFSLYGQAGTKQAAADQLNEAWTAFKAACLQGDDSRH